MSNRTYHPRGVPVGGYACRKHPVYGTWANMLSRCNNPLSASYLNYGGRGISVCTRWYDFANFVEDMGAKPAPELTLERKKNQLGYEPSNCEWATRSEQCVNRRVFSNNTTGATGVQKVNGRFSARFDYELTRHQIGRFATQAEAQAAREDFLDLFFVDKAAALESIAGETLWATSTTVVRGVTPHVDGGFIARATVNKSRIYLGYFPDIQSAEAAIQKAKNEI